MDYIIESASWDLETISEEFKKLIPKGFTPFVLYYFKEYDDKNRTGDEAYLIGVYNEEKVNMIFNIKINEKGKYEIDYPNSFELINFKEGVYKNYMIDEFEPFHYDDRDEPKMLICDKIHERFMQSIASFQECDNDGVNFKYVNLLYVEPENKSDFGKVLNKYLYSPYKHNKIQIETSLNKIEKSVYQVFNINFFFILVICYDREDEYFYAYIYNHIINFASEYIQYEYYSELDVEADDKEEVFDNIYDLYHYEKPNSRLSNVSRKKELLIDNSEDFNL